MKNSNILKYIIIRISLIILAFLSPFAYGSESTSSQIVFSDQRAHYILEKFAEGDAFAVSLYQVDRKGFQQRIQNRIFNNEQEASEYFEKILERRSQRRKFKKLEKSDLPPATYSRFSLWKVENEWNTEWERKFSQWMSQNLTIDYLYNKNIATDCADVAVTYRWVFSFLHGLPVGNTLAGSGRLFTQDSAPIAWQSLSTHENWWQNERFLRALYYIHDNTYTGSLFYDLYPVEISRETINAGAIWLINKRHTYNVADPRISGTSWLKWYSSTLPREVRKLYTNHFFAEQPKLDQDGFQRHRWIRRVNNKWELVAPTQMPDYSLEQYDPEFVSTPDQFEEKVYERLNGQPLPDDIKIRNYMDLIYGQAFSRVSIVENGFETCYPDRCVEGTAEYDMFSTPTRDGRIYELLKKAEALVRAASDENITQTWNRYLETYYVRIEVDGMSKILFMKDILRIWKNQLYSSDPNDPIEIRWGIAPENPDVQSEEEIAAAKAEVDRDFPRIFSARNATPEERARILAKYKHIDPTKIVPNNLREDALIYFDLNKKGFKNQAYVSVVDFSRGSHRARFWVMNMSTGAVESFWTAHGRGSDTNNDGVAERFSNTVDSHMSSIGPVRTGEVYSGQFGRSLRLDGLADTNSNVRRRAIVIHGSDYVHQEARKQGRSLGCPALDWSIKDDLITKVRDGSLIYFGLSQAK